MEPSDFLTFFIVIIFGYLFGSINGAQFIHHVFRPAFPRHMTRIGTKIAGTQNVWVTIGKSPALFVLAIDIGKGYAAVYAARLLDLEMPLALLGGIAAVAGHNWPIVFHFRGGRGVATLVGALLVLDFYQTLLVVVLAQIFTLIRWSGIMPFAVLIGVGYFLHQSFGIIAIFLMIAFAIVIIAKRLHAYWDSFIKAKRKLWVLKNIIWYDRPGANPPALKEIFNWEKI